MHITYAVFFLLIAHVVSYPSLREDDNEESNNDLELELRSILNHLDNEQMERSVTSDEDDDSDDDEYEMSKRQGGHTPVKQDMKCEIDCVHKHRNPKKGKGKTIKDAAKLCKSVCLAVNKKHGNKNTKPIVHRKDQSSHKTLREFIDNDDSNSNSNEDQQKQLREFSDYLIEQLKLNDNE